MWCIFFVPICNKNSLHLQLLISGSDRETVLKQLRDVIGEIEPYYHCTKDHGDRDPFEDNCFDHEIDDDRKTFKAKDKEASLKVLSNTWSYSTCCPFGDDQYVLVELDNLADIVNFKSELANSIV